MDLHPCCPPPASNPTKIPSLAAYKYSSFCLTIEMLKNNAPLSLCLNVFVSSGRFSFSSSEVGRARRVFYLDASAGSLLFLHLILLHRKSPNQHIWLEEEEHLSGHVFLDGEETIVFLHKWDFLQNIVVKLWPAGQIWALSGLIFSLRAICYEC